MQQSPAIEKGSEQALETVVILDFGAQYAQLIARRVREANVYSEILPSDAPWSEISRRNPAAFILTGGPESCVAEGAPHISPEVLASGKPILGICYGMQELVRACGGAVTPGSTSEYGKAELVVNPDSTLFAGVPHRSQAWMNHTDTVTALPKGFVPLASTANCTLAAAGDPARKLYGVQFHPEVMHTEAGRLVLDNFLRGVSGLRNRWEMASFVDRAVAEIRSTVGDAKVICALSGGVDSAVAATLVARAIGDNLTCVFVDHGFLREREAEDVIAAFRDVLHLNLIAVDARQRFLAALTGV